MMVQTKKKALFLGDFKDANWHPATGIDQVVVELLSDTFQVTVSEAYEALTLEALREYDLLILYPDQWKKKGTAQAMGAITAYAATGGPLLALHSGIITPMDRCPELPMLIGARFTNHPPYTDLEYSAVKENQDHPILEGFETFSMGEEPYFFEDCNFARKDLLLEFEYEGKKHPAAWISHFGEGRIVYLSMGHDLKSFKVKTVQRLIQKSALWAVDLL